MSLLLLYFTALSLSFLLAYSLAHCKSTHEPIKHNDKKQLIYISEESQEDGIGWRKARMEEDERGVVWKEVKKQLWLAGPLITVNLLLYSLQLISIMFVGHLGELPLSGASMANSFATVTGFSLLMGISSALETLCGQAYGANQHHLLGIHMQRAMLIITLISIPLAAVWANTKPILILLHQDPEISTEAGKYAQALIPSLFAYGLLQCLIRYLQSQNIVFPMMAAIGITTCLHLLLTWVLVFNTGLEARGAAVATALCYWLDVVLLACYVKLSPCCKRTWTGFSKEALRNVSGFVRLAIPSACMICLELWSFEMIVLLSGLLPNPKLETAVLSISLNTAMTVWMVPIGLSAAVSTRVSNELGAGRPRAARLAVIVVVCMTVAEGVVVGSVLILIRNVWGHVYSNEREVVEYVAKMLPILALSCFLDGIQSVLSGNARGCGWQKIGAFINLGSYYLVGIPLAVVLALVLHVGGKGLWFGIISALVVQVVCLLAMTVRTNWEQEAKAAMDRVHRTTISVD